MSERRVFGEAAYAPRAATGIALATWLWVLASGLAFWLGVARGVLWLV